MNQETLTLRQRLRAIADLIRKDAGVVADIGTDHALLPTYLILNQMADHVIASDVVPGPLRRGKETVEKWGVSERVTLRLGDGLQGLENSGARDIVIAGMGGELIVQILEKAPFVQNPDIRLILQPMTKAEVLRKWLGENKFEIIKETLVQDERLYQIITARYDGQIRRCSLFDCLVGRGNLGCGNALTKQHLERILEVTLTRIEGKRAAGLDTAEEEALLEETKAALKEENP